ncbi:MAG: UDP-N-acetylglucosamine 2-epimerase (non-hydrolyzing) [Candidatus Parcubacteria bacterium]|nr:UDP-N-acetylglucosamine 2-epimerase (non-hydrolyzing) [Candidatus Parcubacteria bacterium]
MKKFKLVTLLGIRPDIIRMHKLIRLLDDGQNKYNYEHIFAHTGQHFDYELDEVFYKELGVRKPEVNFNVGRTLKENGGPATHAYQTALLFQKLTEYVETEKPDAIIYLGDTNTVVSSIIPARYRIPVIHIEGGGRSFDWRMPEEKDRIIIDHLSDVIYCYLPRYKDILLSEGINEYRIKVIGNIIDDALKSFLPMSEKSEILEKLKLQKYSYALTTIHREENTENKEELTAKINGLIQLAEDMPVVFPVMPRVKKALDKFGLSPILDNTNITQTKPLGFLDFLHLEKHAKLIVTDSGTVQEEALILGVPCLVTRLSTERPETIQAGATILANNNLYENVQKALALKKDWNRTILNPFKTSPSEAIFENLIEKIQSGFFKESRNFEHIKENSFVREAYNKPIK